MKKIFIFLLAMGTLLTIHSCKKTTTEPTPDPVVPTTPTTPDGMVKIGETFVLGAKAKAYIYAKQALFTGYNTIYVAMYDSADGTQLTDGKFNLIAEMDMGTMKHTGPVELNENCNATTKLYSTSLVFGMPTVMMGKWYLHVGYQNQKNNLTGLGTLEVTVNDANPKRLYSSVLAGDDSAKVLVSFVLPSTGKVGLNDAEFTIHKMASYTSFPAVNDYTIQMIPTMPSMGHGSPNNVNPTLTSNGHYMGKLNFTMTGLWRIQLKLYKNSVLLTDQIFFDITL
jgi:hypothetical protein